MSHPAHYNSLSPFPDVMSRALNIWCHFCSRTRTIQYIRVAATTLCESSYGPVVLGATAQTVFFACERGCESRAYAYLATDAVREGVAADCRVGSLLRDDGLARVLYTMSPTKSVEGWIRCKLVIAICVVRTS